MQTADMRERLFNIRMNDEESARMDALAAHYGITASAVVRMLVKREADTLGLAVAPKRAPARKTKR